MGIDQSGLCWNTCPLLFQREGVNPEGQAKGSGEKTHFPYRRRPSTEFPVCYGVVSPPTEKLKHTSSLPKHTSFVSIHFPSEVFLTTRQDDERKLFYLIFIFEHFEQPKDRLKWEQYSVALNHSFYHLWSLNIMLLSEPLMFYLSVRPEVGAGLNLHAFLMAIMRNDLFLMQLSSMESPW